MHDSHETETERFRRDGCYRWRSFLDAAEVGTLRRYAGVLLDGEKALHTPESVRLVELYRHGRPFVDLMCKPELNEVVTDLLGKGAVLSDLSLNEVRTAGKDDVWHIDYPYSRQPDLDRGEVVALQCVLALSPFTPRTGATQFIPGSFRRPGQPPQPPADPPATFLAEPGDLLILAASAWHRAGTNHAADPRTAILLSYVKPTFPAMFGEPEGDGAWSRDPRVRELLGIGR
ncbi:phytanoyl-CoA dioxygenase family protein [Micromonospora sp. NPDC092111]|uniref:phytanoyl-CoA dioxygenase family protein n=1 Tax=Micromonospora sp. NPDC092111 TaxID=3364289 RepID=UPI00380A6073